MEDTQRDINATDAKGSTALHVAAARNWHRKAADLLSQGADANARNDKGETPLHVAAAKNASKVAEVLLTRGAEVKAKSKNGYTPLHMAAWKAQLETVEVFLAAGADIHARTQHGETPLQIAARTNRNLEVILALLAADAAIHPRTQQDKAPLHISLGKVQLEVAKILLATGVKIYAQGLQAELMEAMLAANADKHARTQQDETRHPVGAMIAMLHAAGGAIHVRTQQDETSVSEAARNDSPRMIEVLMTTGADVHLETRYGTLSLHVAAQEASPKRVEVFVTPLQIAARTDNPEGSAVLSKLRREHYIVKPISELQLSVRVSNRLKAANFRTIRELVRKEEKELLEYKNFGPISLNEIKYQLSNIGLTLGMNLEDEEGKKN